MIEKVERAIDENTMISYGDHVLVSLSGGPDSVALLLVLNKLRQRYGMNLSAFHLNHMLRGNDSTEDEFFCAGLCDELDIKIYIFREDIQGIADRERISLEAAGRKRRYELIEQLCTQQRINKAATAHTMEDSAESVLMNMIRGSGLKGLCGIPPKRGKIIRPLLCVRKKEIFEYLSDNNRLFRTDMTNLEAQYRRNYIRNVIIPGIEEKFETDMVANIVRMSSNLAEDNAYLESLAEKIFNENAKKDVSICSIDISVLPEGSAPIRKRLLQKMIMELKGSINDIGQVHIDDMIDLLGKQSGKRIDLPGEYTAGVEFGKFYVKRCECIGNDASLETIEVEFGMPIRFREHEFVFDVIDLSEKVNIKFKKESREIYLDHDKIKEMPLYIRTRRQGDMISPFERKVTKKLKKYFIEKKIPMSVRSELPMLVSGSEVLWIPGYEYSGKYAVDEGTKKVLACSYKK
jgi:tRNA(Ile)-lysidine synthase